MIFSPCQVYKFRIGRSADQCTIAVAELIETVVEGGNLGRAYEGKVFGPPEHDGPLIYFIIKNVRSNACKLFTFLKRNTSITSDILNKDRKSTRLNSSHVSISYAVFCLKKKI